MPNDLAYLAQRLASLKKAIPAFSNQLKIDVVTSISADLSAVTPADTGAAISNWLVNVDGPDVTTIDAYNPSPRGKNLPPWTHAVDPDITRAANAPAVAEVTALVLSEVQPGQPVFISNNLPYIVKLDQGSSTQFAGGFTDRTPIVGKAALEASQDLKY